MTLVLLEVLMGVEMENIGGGLCLHEVWSNFLKIYFVGRIQVLGGECRVPRVSKVSR